MIEAYIPSSIQFEGHSLDESHVVTLYNPDGDQAHGSVTTGQPLLAGTRGGPLVILGKRDGKDWRVLLPQIEVVNKTAVGFEFRMQAPPQRELVGDGNGDGEKKREITMGDLGATF